MAEGVKVAARRVSAKKLIIRFGRGRLGGTTYLDALAQRAIGEARTVLVVDADVRNPSLSKMYPPAVDADGKPIPGTGAVVPEDEGSEAFDAMMKRVLSDLSTQPGPISAVVDIGGGQDRTMADFIRDLNLIRYCKRAGVMPVAAYMIGPNEDDLAHALSVRDSGVFDTEHVILVQNEALVKRSQTARTAFGPILGNREYQTWVTDRGARPVWMRNLGCIELVRGLGLSLNAAKAGKPGEGGKALNQVEAWQIEDWMDDLVEEHRLAEALDLLP